MTSDSYANLPHLPVRMRRLRGHPKIRALIRETQLSINDLILPLFIHHGENRKHPIASMPGHYQLSIDRLGEEIQEIAELGIPGVILFGIPEQKDTAGSDSYSEHGIIQQAIRTIKEVAPELLVICDNCFCEYMTHGHCGVLSDDKQIIVDNDLTLQLLAKQAISFAKAGADVVAPSGMIDGMVAAMRQGLDAAGFSSIPILSYAAKYASAFYSPFRDAAYSASQFGDRRSYQMDPANGEEAIREVELDLAEGADIIMIKPATLYLDVLYRVKQHFPGVPLAAYHVSGEYVMIKAAVQNGFLDEQKVVLESLLAIKRAGANFIITYYAKDVARWLIDL